MNFPIAIPSEREFDVFGFGTNAVDYLVTVPEYPKFNSKVRLTDYVQAAGGEIATTLAGLSRLGMKTIYAGRFGDDQEGAFGMASLRDDGVNVDLAQQMENARTQIAFIIIDERSGERTVIWERDGKLSYSPEEAPIGITARSRAFHFTPHDTAACELLAKEARASGTIVSIDIDNLFDGIEKVLPLVDVMITSSDFPQRLFGIADTETALREMHSRYGCALIGITLGESGSMLYCNGELVRSKGFAAPGGCKDTTGAGDAFRTGLLYGLLNGESVEESAKMANAVAALKCRQVGARTALPRREELSELISSNG